MYMYNIMLSISVCSKHLTQGASQKTLPPTPDKLNSPSDFIYNYNVMYITSMCIIISCLPFYSLVMFYVLIAQYVLIVLYKHYVCAVHVVVGG